MGHLEIDAVIPYRADETGPHDDKGPYCERPLTERMINRLKRFQRVVTRYDTLASDNLALVTFAMILAWL